MNKTKEQSEAAQRGREWKTMKEKLKCCDNLVAGNLTDISRSTLKGLQIHTHTHAYTHTYTHAQQPHEKSAQVSDGQAHTQVELNLYAGRGPSSVY